MVSCQELLRSNRIVFAKSDVQSRGMIVDAKQPVVERVEKGVPIIIHVGCSLNKVLYGEVRHRETPSSSETADISELASFAPDGGEVAHVLYLLPRRSLKHGP